MQEFPALEIHHSMTKLSVLQQNGKHASKIPYTNGFTFNKYNLRAETKLTRSYQWLDIDLMMKSQAAPRNSKADLITIMLNLTTILTPL